MINPLFEYHNLNEDGKHKAAAIAEAFNGLLNRLEDLVGHATSREYSLTKTKLEEACFYAKKAVAMQEANQG